MSNDTKMLICIAMIGLMSVLACGAVSLLIHVVKMCDVQDELREVQ